MHAVSHPPTVYIIYGGINFGDLVKNSPIPQIKIPAKVSGYTVVEIFLYFVHTTH